MSERVPFNHKVRVRTPSRKTAIEPIFGNELFVPGNPKTMPEGSFRCVMSPSGITRDKFTRQWHTKHSAKAFHRQARRELSEQLEKEARIKERRREEIRQLREKNEHRFLESLRRGEPHALKKLAEIKSFDRMLQSERHILLDPAMLETHSHGKLSRDISPLSPQVMPRRGQEDPAAITAQGEGSSPPPMVRQTSGSLLCDMPSRPYSLYNVVHPVGLASNKHRKATQREGSMDQSRELASRGQGTTPTPLARAPSHSAHQHSVSFGQVEMIPTTRMGPSSQWPLQALAGAVSRASPARKAAGPSQKQPQLQTKVLARRIPSRDRTWKRMPSEDVLDLEELWSLAGEHRRRRNQLTGSVSLSPPPPVDTMTASLGRHGLVPRPATLSTVLQEHSKVEEHDQDVQFGVDSLWNFELSQAGMM